MIIKPIPQSIQVTVDKEEFLLSSSLQESINKYWDLLIKEKPYLSRGEIFSINNMMWSKEELKITLQKTDYAHFMYSQHSNIDEQYKCCSLVANGVILTTDGYFVIGEMNKFTSFPGRLQFVAGGLEESDIHEDVVDLIGSLSRESQEEIGIDLSDSKLVSRVTPKYIVRWKAIALVYLIELAIDSHQLKLHYDSFESTLLRQGISPEFSSIIFVHANNISSFLENDLRCKLDFLPNVLKALCEDLLEDPFNRM